MHSLLHQSLRPLPGAISVSLEVKARMGPPLAGLDAAHYEAHCHSHSIHLHALYQPKELLHLIHISIGQLLRLALLVLWNLVDVASGGRMTVLHVEPPGVPPLQRGIQWHSNVLARHPIMEL